MGHLTHAAMDMKLRQIARNKIREVSRGLTTCPECGGHHHPNGTGWREEGLVRLFDPGQVGVQCKRAARK